MHAIPTPTPWAPRALRACSVALVLFAFAMSAEGRTRHHHSSTAFKVALEPFTLVHAAVHAVAAPIVHNTPRLAFDAAAAPVRIAYHVSRDRTHPPRGRGSDGDGSGRVPSDAVDTPRRARLVDSAAYAEPIQVAYVVSPSSATQLPPHAEAAEEESEQPRNEEFSGTESTGSKPMVNGSRAILRRGIAFAPSQAPQAVRSKSTRLNSSHSS